MRGTGDVSGSAGPAQSPDAGSGPGPAWVASQTCVLLPANRSLCAPVGGGRGRVTAGGLLKCCFYLHATHARHRAPAALHVFHLHVTSVMQTLNSFRTPWYSHLSVSTTGNGGGEFKGHRGGSIIQSEQLFCAGSPLKVGSRGEGNPSPRFKMGSLL